MQKGQLAEGEKTIADGENVQMNKPAKPYHYDTSILSGVFCKISCCVFHSFGLYCNCQGYPFRVVTLTVNYNFYSCRCDM